MDGEHKIQTSLYERLSPEGIVGNERLVATVADPERLLVGGAIDEGVFHATRVVCLLISQMSFSRGIRASELTDFGRWVVALMEEKIVEFDWVRVLTRTVIIR